MCNKESIPSELHDEIVLKLQKELLEAHRESKKYRDRYNDWEKIRLYACEELAQKQQQINNLEEANTALWAKLGRMSEEIRELETKEDNDENN